MTDYNVIMYARGEGNMKTVRVNLNLPEKLSERVNNYAKEMGLNKTSGYIVLLNQALTQIDMQKSVPELVNSTKDLEKIAVLVQNNKQD